MALVRQALHKKNSEALEKPEELNIAEFLSKARKHAVLSLLYDVLRELPSMQEYLPAIEADSRQIAMQSYRLLFLTKYVVNVLQEAGIPAAVLKGVATAGMYPVPELRKSGDVDLLVPETVTNKQLCEVMEAVGFQVSEEQHANHHLAFVSPEGLNVEIHTMLAEPFAYKEVNRAMEKHMTECMQHIQYQNIMGIQLPILDRPYHAYELLLHMLQHFVYAGFGLKLLCDWVVMWQQDWSEEEKALFAQLVTESGLKRFTEVVTEVCAKFLVLDSRSFAWEFSIEPIAEEFLREILDAEEFGNSDNSRMVMLSGTGIPALVKEFHHQMQLNFPKAGKCFLFWPVLWVITLIRFLRNNRRVRNTSAGKVLKEATRRSRLMEQLKLFS